MERSWGGKGAPPHHQMRLHSEKRWDALFLSFAGHRFQVFNISFYLFFHIPLIRLSLFFPLIITLIDALFCCVSGGVFKCIKKFFFSFIAVQRIW